MLDTGSCAGGQCLRDAYGDYGCFCHIDTEAGCPEGLVCETVVDAVVPACFAPVVVAGRVVDLATDAPVAGARVMARDADFTLASAIAVSDDEGRYEVAVSAPRTADGTWEPRLVFVRVEAQDYLTFPTAPRVSAALDLGDAVGSPPRLESASTEVALVRLPPGPRGRLHGVLNPSGDEGSPAGALLVAGQVGGPGGGVAGIADVAGNFEIFNVVPGDVVVTLRDPGIQYEVHAPFAVRDGDALWIEPDPGRSYRLSGGEVTGSVRVAQPGYADATSVVLWVAETYDAVAGRGEPLPGGRASPVTTDFAFLEVPDGDYVVAAAWENDDLIADPAAPTATATAAWGETVEVAQLGVVHALERPTPGGEASVGSMPVFSWDDGFGEDHYEVQLFDAFGAILWEATAPAVTDRARARVPYTGSELAPGLYRFRAVAADVAGLALTATEDATGVFQVR